MIFFPTVIDREIIDLLSKSEAHIWIKSATNLSLKYRTNRNRQGAHFIKSYEDALGYLALRAPSTYSQIYGALNSIKELNGSWSPQSILDIGSGPGTALWAAKEIFPSIQNAVAIEKEDHFISLGQSILSPVSEISVGWKRNDFSSSLPRLDSKFDLVIVANVLNEMDANTMNRTIAYAFAQSKGVVLIVEPGTPQGYETIKEAAHKIKSSEYKLIAPYIKNVFIDSDEVNFVQRIKRTDSQKRIKQHQRKNSGTEKEKMLPASDWEETKYYYLAYSNHDSEIMAEGRLLETPVIYKPYIQLKILQEDGITIQRILKTNKENFKSAKKLRWGDII
jgi:ribosomal protein RSM22 (predicted rRNA methylase)